MQVPQIEEVLLLHQNYEKERSRIFSEVFICIIPDVSLGPTAYKV